MSQGHLPSPDQEDIFPNKSDSEKLLLKQRAGLEMNAIFCPSSPLNKTLKDTIHADIKC